MSQAIGIAAAFVCMPFLTRIKKISFGGALVIMIAYGIIKASLATGDPRGLEGAKSTWSYALFGFFVIVLSWFLILFIRRLLGMSAGSDLSPGGFIDDIKTEIQSLIEVGHSSSSGN